MGWVEGDGGLFVLFLLGGGGGRDFSGKGWRWGIGIQFSSGKMVSMI